MFTAVNTLAEKIILSTERFMYSVLNLMPDLLLRHSVKTIWPLKQALVSFDSFCEYVNSFLSGCLVFLCFFTS